MRIRRKRKKGTSKPNVIGKNCKFIIYSNGIAFCQFSDEYCNKTAICGYEENSRIVNELLEKM